MHMHVFVCVDGYALYAEKQATYPYFCVSINIIVDVHECLINTMMELRNDVHIATMM